MGWAATDMANASVIRELSMEEILQKIERSMMDEAKPEPATSALRSAEVVDLTDTIWDNDPLRDATAVEERTAPGLTRPSRRAAAPSIEAAPPHEAVNDEGDERLSSDAAAEPATGVQQAGIDQHKAVMAGARTLEDLMGELLRPQLQGWLDAKLPAIIERQVRAELARAFSEAARS
jgi:cell pole-organizing protein PopZ